MNLEWHFFMLLSPSIQEWDYRIDKSILSFRMSWNFPHMGFALFLFIPKYIIFPSCIVSGTFSFILSSNWLLFLYEKAIGFYMLILNIASLLNSFIIWVSFNLEISRYAMSYAYRNNLTSPFPFFFFFLIFIYLFILLVFRASPVAYGGSQARGLIGTTAASLRHSHSKAGSKPRLWPTPQLTATPDP